MTLRFDSCSYRYGRRPPVLDGLSYELPPGLTLLLGPNGAGKSTLLALAAAVRRTASGTITLGRLTAPSRAYRRAVAWMPQTIVPAPALTVREYVAYVGWLKGMNRRDAWDRAAGALDRVDLGDRAGVRTGRLSGGQLRRLGVASALVHGARVLLLDEPTAGMDPWQRRVFRDALGGLSGEVRILMSTHDTGDLAEEADHVTVLVEGRIRHAGDVRSFLAHSRPGTPPARAAESAYTAFLTSTG
ncbi:ATP-binding cassette domain-containing protein [Streptomyces sp. NPDC057638]|uniref:ATP-binding cassette domain-containing protein n=1 Tax=Streptomyces sp. NPDC057638 TaxID=3346190 RepID=UPI0036949AF2